MDLTNLSTFHATCKCFARYGRRRTLPTDCYLLKLIGMANSTSTENEKVAMSKVVAGAKFGSTFVARMSGFVNPEEQLGLHK